MTSAPDPKHPSRIRPLPKVGQRFGRWTVVGPALFKNVGRQLSAFIPCKCDCGERRDVNHNNLRNGMSSGCNACRLARQARAAAAKRVCRCGGRKVADSELCRGCAALAKRGRPVGVGRRSPLHITLAEAGRMLGVTKQRVGQLVKKHGSAHVVAMLSQTGVGVNP